MSDDKKNLKLNKSDSASTEEGADKNLIDEVAEAICDAGRSVWDDPNSSVKYTTKPDYKDLSLNTKEYYQAMALAAIKAVKKSS